MSRGRKISGHHIISFKDVTSLFNTNISNCENYNIITSNLVNSSIGENRGNLSNFLNNECVNIYVTWHRLYNFLLGGRDTDIIDLNYKKE